METLWIEVNLLVWTSFFQAHLTYIAVPSWPRLVHLILPTCRVIGLHLLRWAYVYVRKAWFVRSAIRIYQLFHLTVKLIFLVLWHWWVALDCQNFLDLVSWLIGGYVRSRLHRSRTVFPHFRPIFEEIFNFSGQHSLFASSIHARKNFFFRDIFAHTRLYLVNFASFSLHVV